MIIDNNREKGLFLISSPFLDIRSKEKGEKAS